MQVCFALLLLLFSLKNSQLSFFFLYPVDRRTRRLKNENKKSIGPPILSPAFSQYRGMVSLSFCLQTRNKGKWGPDRGRLESGGFDLIKWLSRAPLFPCKLYYYYFTYLFLRFFAFAFSVLPICCTVLYCTVLCCTVWIGSPEPTVILKGLSATWAGQVPRRGRTRFFVPHTLLSHCSLLSPKPVAFLLSPHEAHRNPKLWKERKLLRKAEVNKIERWVVAAFIRLTTMKVCNERRTMNCSPLPAFVCSFFVEAY